MLVSSYPINRKKTRPIISICLHYTIPDRIFPRLSDDALSPSRLFSYVISPLLSEVPSQVRHIAKQQTTSVYENISVT